MCRPSDCRAYHWNPAAYPPTPSGAKIAYRLVMYATDSMKLKPSPIAAPYTIPSTTSSNSLRMTRKSSTTAEPLASSSRMRADGDVLPEALSPDDEARGHDRAPRRRDQDEAPGFFFVAIHPADDPQPERGRRQAGERAHRRHLGARRAREYEDVDQQQPQQCREAQEHCRADEVAPAHGWVAGRGAHPDEGAHRDQSDGQQSIERRAAGDGVEVDVVKDRARDQHEAEHNCDRDRDRIACRPARTRIRAPSRGEGAHYLSTKTTRRPITSTGRPPS